MLLQNVSAILSTWSLSYHLFLRPKCLFTLSGCLRQVLLYYRMVLIAKSVQLQCNHMGLVARKPVFGVSNKMRLKPASSATETRFRNENLLVASLDMIVSNKRITKALMRRLVCAFVVRKPLKTGFLASRPI